MRPALAPAFDTVHLLGSGPSEQIVGQVRMRGLDPSYVLPSVMPFSSAATRPNGLNAEPGLRRPWTARSNWLCSKGSPEAITSTAPVWLLTIVKAPVGEQELASAYEVRFSIGSLGKILVQSCRFSS